MKVAFVHDDLVQSGGAEKLFETIAEIFPKAPIYTSLVDWQKLPKNIKRSNEERPRSSTADFRVPEAAPRLKTSFIQKIPFAKKLYKILLPLYPFVFESFNFDEYDVVISSTTRFAKAIITKPSTIHICYINSLPRFLWDEESQNSYLPYILRVMLKPYFSWLRRWDLASSTRVDYYVANSKNIQDQVKQIYRRGNDVIYPYVDTDYFYPAKEKHHDYLLVVTRLIRWKKVEIAIQAAKELKKKLIIVGSGPDENRLKRLADNDPDVFFAGFVSDSQLKLYFQFAFALIVTQKEDFGLSTVESLACGRPVIAYGEGGQTEIVTDRKTGILFKNQTQDSLKDAIMAASRVKWDLNACRNRALQFTKDAFIKNLKSKIEKYAPATR